MPQSPQVLIVGAGPAGLAAALTLLKNGVNVRVIEKDLQHHRGFRGSGIVPRTQEIEYFLGVLEDVKKHAFETPTRHKYDSSDPYKLVGTMKMVQEVDPTPAFPMTEPFSIAQYLHQAALRSYVERLGTEVELGTSATTLSQDDNSVSVDIVKIKDGAEIKETTKFAYVIGADGGRSTIRKALDIKFVGETRDDEKRYIADVRIKGFEGRGMHVWNVRGGNGTILRYAGEIGRYQIMLGGPSIDYALLSSKKDVQTLQTEFNNVSKRNDIEILEVIWQSEWRPNIRMAEQFRVGHVFIVGDAAHTHSPSGGQGLNTSIADAFNLGWKLALVLKGKSPSLLLDSYELERIPIISEMLEISTTLHDKILQQAFQQVQAQAQADAAAAAATNSDNAFFRDWQLFQLDVNYRHSSFILDDRHVEPEDKKSDVYGVRGHAIRGGDRAPDAPGLTTLSGSSDKGISRLFEIFNPSTHTVLIFSSATAEGESFAFTQSVLKSLGRLTADLVRTALIVGGDATVTDTNPIYSAVDFVLKDTEGHAFENYGVDGGKSLVVIVRPDTYIGAFVSDHIGVDKYLSLVFERSS